MAEFIRTKDISAFRLKDLNEYEDAAIWKSFGLTEDVLGVDGKPLRFPIVEGQLTGIDGIIRDVNELKSMPNQVFKILYPKLTIRRNVSRAIIVQNIEFWYRFAISANRKLNSLIKSISALGQNPLAVNFKKVYNKAASSMNDYYMIEVVETITQIHSLPPQQVVAQQPQININLNAVAVATFPLNENESLIYDAIIKVPVKQDLEHFTKIFKANGVTDDGRIKEIFNS